RDELAGAVRLQQRSRIVEQDPRRTELGQAAARLDEGVVLTAPVEQARVELLARVDDRLRRLAQVADVVERVVEAKHVDAAVGRGRDEAPGEVAPDRTRADQEPPAQ